MSDINPRELVLIPNTVIKSSGISFLEINATLLKQVQCELGSPQRPSDDDYVPAVYVPQDAMNRVTRYKSVLSSEVAALIFDMRVDVAGNLVGKIIPQGPKADKIKRAFGRPKCGIIIHPRIGYEYGAFGARDVKIFGFDVGFK